MSVQKSKIHLKLRFTYSLPPNNVFQGIRGGKNMTVDDSIVPAILRRSCKVQFHIKYLMRMSSQKPYELFYEVKASGEMRI